MLLEIAIGDAYGCGFEYAPKEHFVNNTLDGYKVHPSRTDLKPGQYSDDTQMSIAIAELLLNPNYYSEMNEFIIADKFLECFKRDPRKGYSFKFQEILESSNDANELMNSLAPTSEKNGAAMRSCPIGLLSRVNTAQAIADLQASVTHASSLGSGASKTVATVCHYLNQGKPRSGLRKYLRTYPMLDLFSENWEDEFVGGWAFEAVRAAIKCILVNDTMTGVLKMAVGFRGDTDTTAAIAMGMSSVCKEIQNDIPQVLIDNLENGPYGRDFLIDLDNRLRTAKHFNK